jgi:hypothetical protein
MVLGLVFLTSVSVVVFFLALSTVFKNSEPQDGLPLGSTKNPAPATLPILEDELYKKAESLWDSCLKDTSSGLDEWSKSSKASGCFASEFPGVFQNLDVESKISLINHLSKSLPAFANTCHAAEHEVSAKSSSMEEIIKYINLDDHVCLWGLSHGALVAFAMITSDAEFDDLYPTICNKTTSEESLLTCYHGLGHSISTKVRKTVFDAAPYCDKVSEPYKESCIEAIFMSYSSKEASLGGGTNIPLDPLPQDQVSTMCLRFSGLYQKLCWDSLWSFYKQSASPIDLAKELSTACSYAETEVNTAACFRGLGLSLILSKPQVGDTDSTDVFKNYVSFCGSFTPLGESFCIKGLAEAFTLRWFQEKQDLSTIPDICALVPPSNKEYCVKGTKELS